MTEDNWDISAKHGLLGLGRDAKRRLARMAEGDQVWIYVNRGLVDKQLPRIYEIRAVARVSGAVTRLKRSPWKPRGDQRFEVARPIAIERNLKFKARELLMTMSFAGPPPVWGTRLLNTPLQLTQSDVVKLETAAINSGTAARA
jgi:hypothetical protein